MQQVILTKQTMRCKVDTIDDYELIQPNCRDRDKYDSYHLSPMLLGPVITPITNTLMPVCHNIENFHQGNKIYACELTYDDYYGLPIPVSKCCGYLVGQYLVSCTPCDHHYTRIASSNISTYSKLADSSTNICYSDPRAVLLCAAYTIGRLYNLDCRVAVGYVSRLIPLDILQTIVLTVRQIEWLVEFVPYQNLRHLHVSTDAVENIKLLYQSKLAYRHKYKAVVNGVKILHTVMLGKEAPIYSAWFTGKDNVLSYTSYTYIGSRQFYCHYYEVLAGQQPVLTRLRGMLDDGIRLQISGYDAYEPLSVWSGSMEDVMMSCYLDESRPFGHELVLYCMLVLPKKHYPWRKHLTELL